MHQTSPRHALEKFVLMLVYLASMRIAPGAKITEAGSLQEIGVMA